jgi:hypothetical protein
MSNRHWLEGIVGNTCAGRTNVPLWRRRDARRGWFGLATRGSLFKLNMQLDSSSSTKSRHTSTGQAGRPSPLRARLENGGRRRRSLPQNRRLSSISMASPPPAATSNAKSRFAPMQREWLGPNSTPLLKADKPQPRRSSYGERLHSSDR